MPDLLFINNLPYLVIVSLFMIEPSGEHRLLETRNVEGLDRTTFLGRTCRSRGARYYMLFRNNLQSTVRLQAFLDRKQVVDRLVESRATTRLEGFTV